MKVFWGGRSLGFFVTCGGNLVRGLGGGTKAIFIVFFFGGGRGITKRALDIFVRVLYRFLLYLYWNLAG